VNLETALKIILNPTVKFTQPFDLNDPFEITTLFYESNNRSYLSEENSSNYLTLSMSYGILSLSRTPLNSLMWAHYARGERMKCGNGIVLGEKNTAHGGMVIGIDVNEAGLNNESYNIIPAKFGSVIYTTTKPTHSFSNSENHSITEGMQCNFDARYLEALQRIFLYKASHWSYEEEVRVVRNINRMPLERYKGNNIYEIDKESIKEIYIGSAHSFYDESKKTLYDKIKLSIPSCKIFLCNTKGKNWDINAEELKS
jgi:hypothetical protein